MKIETDFDELMILAVAALILIAVVGYFCRGPVYNTSEQANESVRQSLAMMIFPNGSCVQQNCSCPCQIWRKAE